MPPLTGRSLLTNTCLLTLRGRALGGTDRGDPDQPCENASVLAHTAGADAGPLHRQPPQGLGGSAFLSQTTCLMPQHPSALCLGGPSPALPQELLWGASKCLSASAVCNMPTTGLRGTRALPPEPANTSLRVGVSEDLDGDGPGLSGGPPCNHRCPSEEEQRGLRTHRGTGHAGVAQGDQKRWP